MITNGTTGETVACKVVRCDTFWKRGRGLMFRRRRAIGVLLAALLVGQIGLGISNVLFSLPLGLAVAHNLGAALLLATLAAANFRRY